MIMARVTSQILSTELISFDFPLFHSPNPPAYISQTAGLRFHLLFPSISSLSLPVFLPTPCLYFFTLLACISSLSLPVFLHPDPPYAWISPCPLHSSSSAAHFLPIPRSHCLFHLHRQSRDWTNSRKFIDNSFFGGPRSIVFKVKINPSFYSSPKKGSIQQNDLIHNVERICMPKVSHNLFKSGHLWIRH